MVATLTNFGNDMHKAVQGNNAHRLKQNPLEARFAEVWAEKVNRGDILKYLLSHPTAKTLHFPTENEEMVAATIIQWLGSPVGQAFLTEVLGFEVRDLIADELKDVS